LALNITGAFLLGLLNTLFIEKLTLTPEMRLVMTVGFLGAYTTFSTFGYETIMLIKDGNILTAGIYTVGSIIIGFLGIFLGMGLARLI
jgi:CrcB protein